GTQSTPNETPIRFGSLPLYATTVAAAALPTSTRPAPMRPTPIWLPPTPPTVVKRSCVAVLHARANTSCTLHVGCSCLRSDIMPATCGVADDVPLKFWTPLPLKAVTGCSAAL